MWMLRWMSEKTLKDQIPNNIPNNTICAQLGVMTPPTEEKM